MPHINEEVASLGLRAGIQMMGQALQENDDTDMIAKHSELAKFVVRDILPQRGQVDASDLLRQTEAKGRELGLDPLDSINLVNNIFKSGDLMAGKAGGTAEDMLDFANKQMDLKKKVLDYSEKQKSEPQKAIEKQAGENISATMESVTALKDALSATETELQGVKAGDLPERYAVRSARRIGKVLGVDVGDVNSSNFASVIAEQLKKRPEFQPYTKDSIMSAINKIRTNPSQANIDNILIDLRTPDESTDSVQSAALASMITK